MKNLRNIKSCAWCWQQKDALRQIRDAFDGTNTVSSGLGVYVALTEIASDSQSDVFKTTHRHIAGLSGLSTRTIQSRLADLEKIGLITVETSEFHAPGTYRLLASGNDCATIRNDCASPFGNQR